MFPRSLRVLATTLCTFLVLGLCVTTAEARGVTRVNGLSRAGQDWQDAKLKIRWSRVKGAKAYRMRVSASPKRMSGSRYTRTRQTSAFTMRLNRSKTWYVQVRAIKRGTKDLWSRKKAVRFVRPRTQTAPVYTPPAKPPATLYGFWGGKSSPTSSFGVRANYERVRGYLGDPQVYRMFHPGLPPADFKTSDAAYGPPVVVSFKASPAEIAAGKHDARIRAWFASIPTDLPVWWSYWHEPEDDIARGSFTAVQYRAAWAHLLTLAPKRDTLRSTMILMAWSGVAASGRNISDYVSGLPEKGLQVLAWDSYLAGGSAKTADGVVDPFKRISESFGLGFAIAETSVSPNLKVTGKSTAHLNLELATRFKTNPAGAEFVTWFESYKSEEPGLNGDWRIVNHPAAVDVYKNSPRP